MVLLGGEPLIARPLAAARAAGLDAVVVAKPGTELPDVPVWHEPDEPSHPLVGLVTALEHGPVVAVACDQPWLTPELLRALAEHDGPAIAVANEPFPGRYEPSQLPVLRAALAAEASLRATLEQLAPAVLGVPRELVASVNTREDLEAAERVRRRPARAARRGRAGERRRRRAAADARRRRARARDADIAVVGGGIVGCALAAFLAEGGARVVLYEREAIAAGASGRNSGVVQDPLDPALTGLYEESLEHYRDARRLRAAGGPGRACCCSASSRSSTRATELIEDPHALEPALAPGLFARRLETGRPVPPAAAAHAWAQRAQAAGARIGIGERRGRRAARA